MLIGINIRKCRIIDAHQNHKPIDIKSRNQSNETITLQYFFIYSYSQTWIANRFFRIWNSLICFFLSFSLLTVCIFRKNKNFKVQNNNEWFFICEMKCLFRNCWNIKRGRKSLENLIKNGQIFIHIWSFHMFRKSSFTRRKDQLIFFLKNRGMQFNTSNESLLRSGMKKRNERKK